jgi:hypothetical protein
MGPAISQIGLALASGVFRNQLNLVQRWRLDTLVTRVPKGPLWFLVVVCLAYAALGSGVVITALILRRKDRVAAVQATLVPKPPTGLRQLFIMSLHKVTDLVGLPGLVKREVKSVEDSFVQRLDGK